MKNRKKAQKQLRHLQSIYDKSAMGESGLDGFVASESSATGGVLTMKQNKYSVVRRDLVFLLVLIVIMVAILFTLNYLAETTSFGTWLNGLVGKIL
jgi:hypothetical protein